METCPICGAELLNGVCPKHCSTTRTMKTDPLTFSMEIERGGINVEERTVPLSFSSETPVPAWFGLEIVDHSPGAMVLTRAKNGLPFTLDHGEMIGRAFDIQIGSDRRGRAVVRFGKGARADEEFQNVQDGIRTDVSFRAQRIKTVLEKRGDKGASEDLYRTVKWMPYEISLVTIPGDHTVGIGRSATAREFDTTIIEKKENIMEKCAICGADLVNGVCPKNCSTTRSADAQGPDLQVLRDEAGKIERSRTQEILSLGKQYELDANFINKHISEGTDINIFRSLVLKEIANAGTRVTTPELTEKEQKQYSIVRAMRAAAGLCRRDEAGFEYEVSEAMGKFLSRGTEGVFVPTGLSLYPIKGLSDVKRTAALDTTTGGTEKAGYNVATQVMPIIELLRNKMLVMQLGAQVLAVRNPISFPRQAGAVTLAWTAENPGSDASDTYAVFEQLLLTPKTGIATTQYTKQLLMESSNDIENFVRNDLAMVNAIGIDYAAINGGGGSAPTGILQTSGIGAIAGGTHGLAPAWSHIVGLESEVAVDNADYGNLAYLTNTKVRGVLKQTLKTAGVSGYIWENGEGGFGSMNGYRAAATTQVPSTLTKGGSTGVCSAIIFGNWAEVIIAEFGVMEIIVDPYAKKKQALIEVTSTIFADVGLRHVQSMAAMKDALTA